MTPALHETWDEVRNGARLVLELKAAFFGQVENTTDGLLQDVRVEVRLSNGVELAPEVLDGLPAGEIEYLRFPLTPEALAQPFSGWRPRVEVRAGEDGERGLGGEGSGASLALDEVYDEVRKGARLALQMEAAFVGEVENTTNAHLEDVRIEVHLSNGMLLGPEALGYLPAGEIEYVRVPVTPEALAQPFSGWTPHAAVGAGGENGG